MAAYSYKRVAYRDDFREMETTFKDRYGEEADGDPSYLGDNWVIAADLLEEKDARIAELEARCAKMRERYAECIDDLQDWGGYASDYFAQKYDFAGMIAAHKKSLAEGGEHG